MKVLLVTYWPIPHVGGIWPYMTQIKSRLEKLGHSVDIMGNSPDLKTFHVVGENREVSKELIMPMLERKLSLDTFQSINRNGTVRFTELDRYCMELAAVYLGVGDYDVIHAQDVIAAAAMDRVRSPHTALVANIHGSVSREIMLALEQKGYKREQVTMVSTYYSAMEVIGASSADVTICSSEWLKRILVAECRISEERIAVYPYGLDADAFLAKAREGTAAVRPFGKKMIICPARLTHIKGIHFLLPALAGLKLYRQDWVCWIVGEGDMRQELEEQSSLLGLQENVRFWGYRQDVPAMLQLADVFVHPSVQDNQPFSVMEAQMSGLPCLVSDAGGLPEMVQHEVNGLVHPTGDIGCLTQQLRFILENNAVRGRMGASARAWAQSQWSMDRLIERLLGAYSEAGAKKHRVRGGE